MFILWKANPWKKSLYPPYFPHNTDRMSSDVQFSLASASEFNPGERRKKQESNILFTTWEPIEEFPVHPDWHREAGGQPLSPRQ
jgi:hypothetical protein